MRCQPRIDMRDIANVQTAIGMALASSDADVIVTCEQAALSSMPKGDGPLWCVMRSRPDEPGHGDVCAITGDGTDSEANAIFYGNARKIVLGLVDEVERLQTILRNMTSIDGHPSSDAGSDKA